VYGIVQTKHGSKIIFRNFRRRVILILSASLVLFLEIRGMIPEERERLNNLCKRIEEDEQNPKVFDGLLGDLMPTHAEPMLRCAYCWLWNDFRPMIMRAEGWLQCESCGHNAMPLDPEFRCTCANCEGRTSPLHSTGSHAV